MKARELIKQLREVIERDGDLDVHIPDISQECEPVDVRGVVLMQGSDDDSTTGFMIADEETYLAFID
jgi:hypothetical protein